MLWTDARFSPWRTEFFSVPVPNRWAYFFDGAFTDADWTEGKFTGNGERVRSTDGKTTSSSRNAAIGGFGLSCNCWTGPKRTNKSRQTDSLKISKSDAFEMITRSPSISANKIMREEKKKLLPFWISKINRPMMLVLRFSCYTNDDRKRKTKTFVCCANTFRLHRMVEYVYRRINWTMHALAPKWNASYGKITHHGNIHAFHDFSSSAGRRKFVPSISQNFAVWLRNMALRRYPIVRRGTHGKFAAYFFWNHEHILGIYILFVSFSES